MPVAPHAKHLEPKPWAGWNQRPGARGRGALLLWGQDGLAGVESSVEEGEPWRTDRCEGRARKAGVLSWGAWRGPGKEFGQLASTAEEEIAFLFLLTSKRT